LILDPHDQEKKVSVIIPTLNEVSNIKHVFPYIPQFVDEIIVIDGNSTDGTRDEVLKFREDAKIIIDKTPGKGTALRKGFDAATGDLIVMMDADGSHDPKEIPSLLEPVLNGYDATKASRLLPGGGSDDFTLFRKIGNKIFITMVNKMYGADYTDLCYGYRAFKKEAVEKMYCEADGFEIETEQSIRMIKAGLKVKEVPSFEAKRKNGDSRLHSIRDGWRIFRLIVLEYLKDISKNERR
jgi:glycosyltransferase involved in cell wall biosynthesis